MKGRKDIGWKSAWSYLPVNYGASIGPVQNVTQRTCFWNNLSGKKVHLKFSNLYGREVLRLEKVVLGRKGNENGKITDLTAVKKMAQNR